MDKNLPKYLRVENKRSDESWGQYYSRHELQFGVLIFVLGFLWDVFTQPAIDDTFAICQQLGYLAFIGLGIYIESLDHLGVIQVKGRVSKLWKYRDLAMHFFLGSLLSLYTLFFFKSSSLAASFGFMLLIVVLLIANELPQLQSKGPIVRLAIWTLCLVAFYSAFVPLLFGSVGVLPFLVAVVVTAVILQVLRKKVLSKVAEDKIKSAKRLFFPAQIVLGLYLLAYLFKLTPPVPLSINSIGIYHKVEKLGGQYVLTEDRPWWKFWQSGDQKFYAKPGDKIFVYATVYSPTRFADEVRIRWLYKDKRGWNTSDLIPMKIVGGRGEGYRGFAFKSNYQAGEWRVQIETTDEREIGRIGLEVIPVQAIN